MGIVLFLVCCLLGTSGGFAFWEKQLTYEGESVYNYLQVKEDDESVVLSTNVLFGVQSILKKDKGLTGMYYDYAMAAPLMAGVQDRDQTDVLVLGMGTGTFATQCGRYFDGVRIEGVEIDEKITKLARQYFELPEEVPVVTYDGRAYLNAVDRKYDVIMVDAFQDITIPFQMSTVEFFMKVKEHLNSGGVMVVNFNMRGQEEGNINQYLADTISRVFGQVYMIDVAGSTNRALYAFDCDEALQVFQQNIEKVPQKELADLMGHIRQGMKRYEAGDYVMTDDKAPVELLGMQVIDKLIQGEVKYYKDVYKREGLSGLLRGL